MWGQPQVESLARTRKCLKTPIECGSEARFGRGWQGGQCICLTKFLQVFSFGTQELAQKKKCTSIDTHVLEIDTYYDLCRKNHTSIDTLEIEMTCIT
jgi:hypothetical protein